MQYNSIINSCQIKVSPPGDSTSIACILRGSCICHEIFNITKLPNFILYKLTNLCIMLFLGNFTTVQLIIVLSRELISHIMSNYVPSSLFVMVSWCSFLVDPNIVPGRMVVIVTTLLSLITMYDSNRWDYANGITWDIHLEVFRVTLMFHETSVGVPWRSQWPWWHYNTGWDKSLETF